MERFNSFQAFLAFVCHFHVRPCRRRPTLGSELKQIFIDESDKKLNLLTIYVSDPDIEQYEVRQILDINEISETKISSYRNFDEIKIDFKTKDDIVYITIIK